MNRILLILLVSFFFDTSVKGQRLLVRAGATMPWISYTDTDNSTKVGFSVGIGREIPLGKFYLQPEIGVLQKGCNFNLQTVDHKLTTYYLQIAVPAKFFLNTGKIKLFVLAGPALGIGLGGNYHYEDDGFSVEFVPYPDGGYDLKYFAYIDNRFELTALLGVGIELGDIIIDVRYDHGFTKLYTETHRGDFDNEVISNAANRLFQLSIGFPLKK